MRKVSVFIFFVLSLQAVTAQEFLWDAGFHGFFDNREYFNDYAKHQTIFGSRGYGQGRFQVNENHEFGIGVNALYEFGSKIGAENFNPIIYFRYASTPIDFWIGSFERLRVTRLPNILQSDTLEYYNPNMQGIFLELKKNSFYQNIWIDWTSRQTEINKEVFQIGGTGRAQKGMLFYQHDFIMTHRAKTLNASEEEHIHDNGGLLARIGFDLSSKTSLDSLSISSGYVFSYDRHRGVTDLIYRGGCQSELLIHFKRFGLNTSLYVGDNQNFLGGDAMYKASSYCRIDSFWKIFDSNHLKGKVEFSFHILPETINYSQLFTVYMNIGGRRELNTN